MDQDGSTHTLTVGEGSDGERIDRVLARLVAGLSRTRAQALIKAGRVRSEARTIMDPKQRVKRGEVIEVRVPVAEPAELGPEPIALRVAYEDEDVIVIDKPAGLVVHPAAGHGSGTLVNALLAHCGESLSGIGGVRRPGIVHRLDKDTTGLIVVAKTDRAHRVLAEQFAAHGRDGRLERSYLALAWGVPARPRGTIDAPLARSEANRTRIAVAKAGGRRAVTHYDVVERFAGKDGEPAASLLRLALETGRTHQIRVHLAHIGHPLLGDRIYGAGFRASANRLGPDARSVLAALDRQALHAAVLGFAHPADGRRIRLESPLPADLARLVAALRAEAIVSPRKAPGRRR
jgi:23S rRNA pseudouridine1911/1915/1917 synthase